MKRTLTYILLILSTAFWGVSFIMTKELFSSEPGMTVTILITLRLVLASLVMVPTLLCMRKLPRLRRADVKWFLLMVFAEPFIYNLCETSGVRLVSGSLASVIVATIPLFVPFGMWIAYRSRIGLPLIVGVILSLLGVALMLVGGEELSGQWRGLLYLACGVVVAVIYNLILVKVIDHYEPVVITTYQNLIGLLYYLPVMLITDGSNLPLLSFSPKMLLLLLALGICCSTLAFVFYNFGVRELGAAEACIFNNAIPVFTLVAAVLVGQESFSWSKVIGMAIVVGGVVLSQIQPKGGKHSNDIVSPKAS